MDAEVDDAIIRGRAEHGEEGTDVPVGRGRPLELLPIHEDRRPPFPSVGEYLFKPTRGPASLVYVSPDGAEGRGDAPIRRIY